MLSNRVTTPRGAAGPLPLGFGAHHEQLIVEQLPLVYHYVCVPQLAEFVFKRQGFLLH